MVDSMDSQGDIQKALLDEIRRTLFRGDDELFERWLSRPVPALEGKTPNQLLVDPMGIDQLQGYLCDMKYGNLS